MKYSINKNLITGTAIPVSALRSKKSVGIGEFSDLKFFADWCKLSGIDLIQLLPVNDTGFQSSPYSALSAFALHPIYVSLEAIPEAKKYVDEISKLKVKYSKEKSVKFNDVLKSKLKLLKTIYKENYDKIEKNKNIEKWESDNQWIVSYGVFSYLKEKNRDTSWQDWIEYKNISKEDISKLNTEERKNTLFYSWIQYNLEQQLIESAKYLEKIGINLKGDIPILMNVDSVDVWESREIFDINNRAGAPPDMYCEDGQNWGFPTYSWESMKKSNYSWWKSRLKQAAKFYHAYRIDHVLGFFRIWTIPPKYRSGKMGYYSPNDFLTIDDLGAIGISDKRLKWFSEPHIPGHELRSRIGLESNEAIKYLLYQIPNEDLYLFNENIKTVDDILSSDEISDEAKQSLINFYHNIALIKVDENHYATSWLYSSSRAFTSMNEHEKYLFSELLREKSEKSMEIWEEQGRTLLSFMVNSEEMLVCAEDLGTIPACVPKVLEELGILGLHVTRWSKKYEEYGQPYIKPSEYNYLSVSTPAVHDSTTVRQWWSELSANDEISNALNLDDKFRSTPDSEEIIRFYGALLKTSSKIAMFQFQDLLAIDRDLRREEMDSERINVPGSVNDSNWCYRMDLPIEELLKKDDFNNKIRDLINKRG